MNEELQNQITKMLQDGSVAITSVVDKIIQECPDLYNQFILSEFILNMYPIVLFLFSLVILYFALRKKAFNWYRRIDPKGDFAFIFPVITGLLTLAGFVNSLFCIHSLLFLTFAPKIYLLKELNGLFNV